MRAEPRDAYAQNRPAHRTRPKLRPVEETLFVLLSNPGDWFKVDEWPCRLGGNSAMSIALWRRGCEVARRTEGSTVEAFARWTHPVPVEVAPWEVTLGRKR